MPNSTLNNAELTRYSRQILLDSWDIDAQLRLKNSTIAIIGMGGLGTVIAPILVRAGVGVVHLFDFDTIDDSNLQRQLLYTKPDIGQSKALIAKAVLMTHNELVEIHAHPIRLDDDNILSSLGGLGLDLWIDCSDNFAIRHLLNQTSIELNTPLLSLSAIGEVGQVCLFEPSQTGCYACLFGNQSSTQASCADLGVLASTVAVISAMGADVALKFLGKAQNTLANQLLLWQGSRLTFQKIHFQKNTNCSVCQNH